MPARARQPDMDRANPFEDLSDFDAQQPPKPPPAAAIEKVAEQSGFVSRKARAAPAPAAPRPARRYVTGRNRQINIKATDETIDRLYRMADHLRQPLGAVLDLALDALEKGKKA